MFRPASILLVLLSLVAAACGAPGGGEPEQRAQVDSTEAPAADDGGTEEDTGASDSEPIRIGILLPTTGNIAVAGQDAQKGWELFWEQRGNTEVAGRPVEFHIEDSAGDPSVGLQKAELLLRNLEVDMIVGPLLGNVALAVAERVAQSGTPHFPAAAVDNLTQRSRTPNLVRIGGVGGSSHFSHPFGDWAYEQGYRSVLTICSDYAFGHDVCGGFVNAFTDRGGEVVEQIWTPLGTQDFGSYMAQIQGANPDAVFSLQVGGDAVRFVDAWTNFGLAGTIPLLNGINTTDQAVLRGGGDATEGLVSVANFVEGRETEATQNFTEAYDEAYGELPSFHSAYSYTMAEWIARALEAVEGNVEDQEAFLEAIRAVEFEDSPVGPLTLDEYDNTIQTAFIRQVEQREDGRFWNVVIDEYEDVSQFWTYDPEEYLEHPPYSREYQGNGVWPEPLS